MRQWEWVALAYFTYLAVVALVRGGATRARGPAVAVAVTGWVLAAWTTAGSGPAGQTGGLAGDVLYPVPVLLIGYWLSGLFFVAPMVGAEALLQRVDDRLLERSGLLRAYRRGPRLLRQYLEFAYLLVYAVVPAGAITLALGGHGDAVPRFWAVVLLAEFASYGALLWIQTRPPRAVAAEAVIEVSGALGRFNRAVLSRASIQVNTIPSGHAAGAVAVALAVGDHMPVAGAVFLCLGASITVATVLGRYHYVLDAVLGVAVAVGAWALVSALP